MSIIECQGHQYFDFTLVRPFIIEDVVLSEQNDLNSEDSTAVHDFLAQKVEDMIKQAEETSRSKVPLKPLIRLRWVFVVSVILLSTGSLEQIELTTPALQQSIQHVLVKSLSERWRIQMRSSTSCERFQHFLFGSSFNANRRVITQRSKSTKTTDTTVMDADAHFDLNDLRPNPLDDTRFAGYLCT